MVVRSERARLSSRRSTATSSRTRRCADITQKIVQIVIPGDMMDKDTRVLINPTGRFVVEERAATPV